MMKKSFLLVVQCSCLMLYVLLCPKQMCASPRSQYILSEQMTYGISLHTHSTSDITTIAYGALQSDPVTESYRDNTSTDGQSGEWLYVSQSALTEKSLTSDVSYFPMRFTFRLAPRVKVVRTYTMNIWRNGHLVG